MQLILQIEPQMECVVCKDRLTLTRFPRTGHLFRHDICRGCVGRYLHGKIIDEGVCHIICPGAECQTELLPEEIREFTSTVIFARYHPLYRAWFCGLGN